MNNTIILFVSSFPPRECGIGTFTKDLTDALDSRFFPNIKTRVLALNREGEIYNYSKKVMFQVTDNDPQELIEKAEKINLNDDIKLVCIQHEFGLYGGKWGEDILSFIEYLKKPLVVTFHSIMPKNELEESEHITRIVKKISEKAKAIIVTSKKASDILQNDYHIDPKIIYFIPHGIHDVKFENQKKEKLKAGMKDRIILSSFGLINSNKGYEYVIDALPKVVEKFPKLLYLIVGKTHPVVEKLEGEKYRNFLMEKVKKLGLQKNVGFYNKFLSLDEVFKYLKMSDIYISAGLDKNQISSGTLAYALGCGRVVISTPFIYAIEMLATNKGILVGFNNPDSWKDAIIRVLSNNELKKSIEYNAYTSTRHMTWNNVAYNYARTFKDIIEIPEAHFRKLPRINLRHVEKLTDSFGMIQFSDLSTPDKSSGYTLDDNALALLLMSRLYDLTGRKKYLKFIKIYLDYLEFSMKGQKMFLYSDINKNLNTDIWSEDAQGKAIYALGYLVSSKVPEGIREAAKKLFLESIKEFESVNFPRAVALAVIGMHYYNLTNKSELKDKMREFADRLVAMYHENSREGWKWFEQSLTYSNSKIPEALFYAYTDLGRGECLEVAKESLNFLIEKTFEGTLFKPVGQGGWYRKEGVKAEYDQQPVEAGTMTEALQIAFKVTGEKKYQDFAFHAFQWFLGKNSLHQIVCNDRSGSCYDGLGRNSINLNQGAEAVLSYLLARLSLMS